MSRSKNFCFTLNNYSDEDCNRLDLSDCFKYVGYGKEVGANLTPHLQGVFLMPNEGAKYSIRSFKKFLVDGGFGDRYHLEIMKGTPAQAILYCQKDGDYTEHGVAPCQGKRRDLDSVCGAIESGEVSNLRDVALKFPAQYVKFGKGLSDLITIRQEGRMFVTEVIWCCGPTGSGKSRWCWEQAPLAYPKMSTNKWWCGYQQEDDVIIDDFRPNKEMPFNYVLALFDRYPMKVEVKGTTVNFLSKRIFVTSPYSPEEILDKYEWLGEEARGQFLRRISRVWTFPRTGIESSLA